MKTIGFGCFLFIALVFGAITGYSQVIVDSAFITIQQGNWSNPLVWKGLRVPDYRDSVVLHHDIVVDINATCRSLNLNGKNISINPGIRLAVDGSSVEINPYALVIDSSKLKLISTPLEKEEGLFKYQMLNQTAIPSAGHVIIDNSDNGYLRLVDSSHQNGDIVSLYTSQGDMEDVFRHAKFGFNLPISSLQEQNSATGDGPSQNVELQSLDDFKVTVEPRNLYSNGPLSIDLVNAELNLKPDMRFDYD